MEARRVSQAGEAHESLLPQQSSASNKYINDKDLYPRLSRKLSSLEQY
jgi:hypothetical protein